MSTFTQVKKVESIYLVVIHLWGIDGAFVGLKGMQTHLRGNRSSLLAASFRHQPLVIRGPQS